MATRLLQGTAIRTERFTWHAPSIIPTTSTRHKKVALNLSTQTTQIWRKDERSHSAEAVSTRIMLYCRPKSIYFNLLPILPPSYGEEKPQIDKPSAQSTLPSQAKMLKGSRRCNPPPVPSRSLKHLFWTRMSQLNSLRHDVSCKLALMPGLRPSTKGDKLCATRSFPLFSTRSQHHSFLLLRSFLVVASLKVDSSNHCKPTGHHKGPVPLP